MKRLQISKNKFARFSINLGLIILWISFWGIPFRGLNLWGEIYYRFFIQYLCWGIGKAEEYSFACQIAYKEMFWYYFGEFIGIAVIILITRYVWFGRIKPRPRITRSKD